MASLNTIKISLVSIFLASSLVAFTLVAQAQSPQESGLAIKPALAEYIGNPGEKISVEILIENLSAVPTPVEIGSRSLLPNDPEIDQSKRPDYDASLWLEPVEKELLFEPGEQKTVEVEINIPDQASPGGHYALVAFRSLSPAAPVSGSQTIIHPEVASTFFITVPGDITEAGSVSLDEVSKVNRNQNMKITAHIANTGNIHLLPQTKIEIKRSDGSLIETLRVSPELVLPNTIKPRLTSWDPDGLFGKFKIDLSVEFGSPSQTTSVSSVEFWILPSDATLLWWISLLVLVSFTLATIWRWPKAAKKIAGVPLRLFTPTKTVDRSKDAKTNQPQIIKKIGVKADPLDELGADKKIDDAAVRKIKVTNPIDNKAEEFLAEQTLAESKKYSESLARKPKTTSVKNKRATGKRTSKTKSKKKKKK